MGLDDMDGDGKLNLSEFEQMIKNLEPDHTWLITMKVIL